MTRGSHGVRIVNRGMSAVCAAWLLLGCNKGGTVQPSKSPSPTAPSATPPALPAPLSETACVDFAKHICSEVGEKALACQQMQTAVTLLSKGACAAAERDYPDIIAKLKVSRKPCTELVDRLCADLGKQTETCDMVITHTKQFPSERCEMMLDRYAEVLTDLRKMEEASHPLTQELQAKIAAADAPSLGKKDAPVVLVVFSDFQCPFCQKAAKAMSDAVAKYPGQVRLVFRHFPLKFHENANGAAKAAVAAAEQGKFWEYNDLLFADQKALSPASYLDYAERLKLNTKRFASAQESDKTQKRIDADIELGKSVSVQGTPTLFVNGKRSRNAADLEALSMDIEAALNKPVAKAKVRD